MIFISVFREKVDEYSSYVAHIKVMLKGQCSATLGCLIPLISTFGILDPIASSRFSFAIPCSGHSDHGEEGNLSPLKATAWEAN